MQALFIFTVSVNLRQQCFIFASYFEFIAAKTGRPVLIPGGICNAMHYYVSYSKQGGIKWGIRGSGILDSEGSHR